MTNDAGRMTPAPTTGSANERFKEQYSNWLWGSISVAVLLHFLVVLIWPTMSVADVSYTTAELAAIELPPEIEVPPPPEAIPRPATPVVSNVDLTEEITIAPTTFEANPIESLPPPPSSNSDANLAAAPRFTPYEVAPRLINQAEVEQAMISHYPPLLRDAGIGGTTVLWFFIDENGRVAGTQLVRSSGFREMDAAAEKVAEIMEFKPAQNRDKIVPVWVQIPVVFEILY